VRQPYGVTLDVPYSSRGAPAIGAEFLIGCFHSMPAIAAAMLNSRASPVPLFTRVRKSL
jgi:hypothetical protein